MADEGVITQVVVVGSSAGGIEALQALVATLPKNFPAPLIIAQHLDPRRPSHLSEILERRSTLPVKTVLDYEKLEPGHVFVIPADQHVDITDGHLNLHGGADGVRPKPSINLLVSSAARTYGEGLIAVILTGTGSDGAAGALEVKQAGGTVVIQNPATASYPSMPQSLAPTAVDFIANIEDMGQLIYDLLVGASSLALASETKSLRSFLAYVHEQSGLDFAKYKPATILRRLKRRMVATGANTLDDYLRVLDQHPEEYQRLISVFLIKVTEFFRNRELFDTLRAEMLPQLIEEARKRSQELRIWTAGCATGEEAYSIAMLVADALGDELEQFAVRIFATDLDAQAIAFARRGIYSSASLGQAPPELVERYFTHLDGDYEVSKRVRSLVVFGQHDLGQRAPFPHIDLILCRNVLIYFGADLQKRVLELFAYSLRNGGILALGKAEATSPLDDFFTPVNSRLRIYRRHGERLLLPASPSVSPGPLQPTSLVTGKPTVASAAVRPPSGGARARNSVERLGNSVLELPIGIAIVDRRYDIQTINAAALRLLDIHHAAIGEDLLHLANGVPQKTLRAIIDAALRGLEEHEMQGTLPVESESGEQRMIHIRAYPQPPKRDDEVVESVTLVITAVPETAQEQARDEEPAAQRDQAGDAVAPDARQSTPEVAARQQQEIERLREQVRRVTTSTRTLREANNELTQVNLELRKSNEEFLITTEELQAATEEVETLNEELQATNEELETLNEELQATIEELNTSNDDLEARSLEMQQLAADIERQRLTSETERARLAAILGAMSDAVLVVDAAGETMLSNSAYARMFGDEHAVFTPEDEHSRSLSPTDMPQQRTARGEAFSMQFALPVAPKHADGTLPSGAPGDVRWFEANGHPLLVEGVAQGGVLLIRDITERTQRRLQNEFLAQAAHELRTPLTSAQAALQLLIQSRERASLETRERHLAIAFAQVKRLGALVNDLVDVARLQNGKVNLQFATVNLVDVVRKATDTLQLSVTQRIEVQSDDGSLLVNGDALRLEQVMGNLLTNAAKYAPHTEHIEVRMRRSGTFAEIAVHDEGPGISKQAASQLFSPFYQATRRDGATHNGLGLGLYITRELVIAHGGDVLLNTAPGKGATFTVRLPLVTEAASVTT
jgi:two-component system, chemotaxis family, CheB/CheR fusion protein